MSDDIYAEPRPYPSRWAYADQEQPVIEINPQPEAIQPGAVLFFDVPRDATDVDIWKYTAAARSASRRGAEIIECTIGGYGDDPRELWEIPEVKKLCGRLVKSGFIGYLDSSTRIAAAMAGTAAQTFGALEIFQLAEGTFKPTQKLDPAHVVDFMTVTWPRAAEAAEFYLARPPQGVDDAGDRRQTQGTPQEKNPQAEAADDRGLGTAHDPRPRQTL